MMANTDSVETAIQVTTIDLLRHGECEGGHCYRGSIDVALNATGQQQMLNRLSLVSPQWQHIITSPLIRCAYFAEQVSNKHNIPLTTEQNFREVSFGEWEGQNIDEVWKTQRAKVEAWGNDPVAHPPPGGEAADEFVARVVKGLHSLLEAYSGKHLLLVSHGGVMRALLVHILSMPISCMNRLDVPFACLSRVQVVHSQGEYYYRLLHHNVTDDLLA